MCRPFHPRHLLLLLLPFFGCQPTLVAVTPDSSPRERISLDADWRFQKNDPAGTGDVLSYDKIKDWVLPSGNDFVKPEQAKTKPDGNPGEKVEYTQAAFDDSGWRKLSLPHDWAIEGPFDQNLPGETGKLPYAGIGWYRKHFKLDVEKYASRKYYLEIDGAMSYSTVWCNGQLVGGWPYGYASYQLDLTPYVKAGADNVLAIRLDNPDESSRWYPGGGIYRNVWLVKTLPVHMAHWGVQVTVPEMTSSSALVRVAVKLENPAAAKVELATAVYEADANGNKIGKPVVAVRFPKGGLQSKFIVKNPKLWNIEKPALYVAVTYVMDGDRTVDSTETTFGIRKAEFTVEDGFHLNGKRVQIQGVCAHSDLGALGSAINTRGLQRQLEILREMGVNAIRTSHNPPAPELLDLCDRMGFLVMDEYADMWSEAKKPNGCARIYADWHDKDMRAYIRRDINHPSVILWSIGNEIPEQGKLKGIAEATELTGIAHEEDPTRPTTLACSSAGAGYTGYQKAVDVFGYNYKPGEYTKWRAANPNQPLFGSETSSTISSRGEYFFPVSNKKGDGKSDFQMSSYDLYSPNWASMPDWEFKGQEDNPSVAGEFVWTGFDYLGEPTPYNSDSTNLLNYHTPEAKAAAEKELKELGKIKVPSRSSYFGIVDLAGFKKDRFYLYQAHWRPELPMAHILPHWNWAGREGEITPVFVYTSGDEAELFLNGQSMGRKKKGPRDYRLRWDDVKYAPGELKVVAYKKSKQWATDLVKTTGAPVKVTLQADRSTITADGQDLSYVTATIQDKDGLMVPRTNNPLKFTISGPGEIIATDNGDATDQSSFQSPERKAFNGLALAIIRTKSGETGAIKLRVASEGMTDGEVTLNAVPAKP